VTLQLYQVVGGGADGRAGERTSRGLEAAGLALTASYFFGLWTPPPPGGGGGGGDGAVAGGGRRPPVFGR
jgi:hypothetical protein